MLFTISWIHGGFQAGLVSFLLWWYVLTSTKQPSEYLISLCSSSLPGAIGMYGLALGISHVGTTLPEPVYALLCGLNAATVGIVALAAVQLARNAITDKLTRLLVFFSGAAGMLYTALWYFPVLMVGAGIVTVLWDSPLLQRTFICTRKRLAGRLANLAKRAAAPVDLESNKEKTVTSSDRIPERADTSEAAGKPTSLDDVDVPSACETDLISCRMGLFIVGLFLASFITVVSLRAALKRPSRGASLFGNLYLAGTMIFGGGPVVIPLLREYIVADGWVSPRDFLLGLAIIQAFPGPNFNFAVYLGALATAGTSLHSSVGAIIGFIGIFTPGILLMVGSMGLWSRLRSRRWLQSLLRGINAAAVGLIYTAVYRLWRVGLVDAAYEKGVDLSNDPWWVAITAGSFVGGAWFGLKAPVAILLGGLMGVLWYAVVKV